MRARHLLMVGCLHVIGFAPIPECVASESSSLTWSTRIEPSILEIRWDDNVTRRPEGSSRIDAISSIGFGAVLVADLRSTWRGEISTAAFGESYRENTDFDHAGGRFILSLQTLPGPLKGSFRKRVEIQRSSHDELDHWDDQIALGLGTTFHGGEIEARYENSQRRFYSSQDALRARDHGEDLWMLEAVVHPAVNLTIRGRGIGALRRYNRYAVGSSTSGLRLLPVVQEDRSLGWALGPRWLFASVLQEAGFEWNDTRSNNYGSSFRTMAYFWTAAVDPLRHLSLQIFCRSFLKRYRADPLNLPEFRLGFSDEEGQGLVSTRVLWEFAPGWEFGFSWTRIRAESPLPGLFYLKRVLAMQIRRRF